MSGVDPQPLAKALSELIAVRGLARVRADAQMAAAWREAAGDKIASRTRVLGLRRRVLQIGVAHAPLLGELASFHRTDLIERLRQQQPDLQIRDIKFVLRGDMSRSGNARPPEQEH